MDTHIMSHIQELGLAFAPSQTMSSPVPFHKLSWRLLEPSARKESRTFIESSLPSYHFTAANLKKIGQKIINPFDDVPLLFISMYFFPQVCTSSYTVYP